MPAFVMRGAAGIDDRGGQAVVAHGLIGGLRADPPIVSKFVLAFVGTLLTLHAAGATVLRAADGVPTADRPNIVIILADDLGWADPGCYGNTFNQTPRIDQLAGEGMRFTQFYAGPVCSPTRA